MAVAVTLFLVGLRIAVFVLASGSGVNALGGLPYPTCSAAGISTPEGREGLCARGGGFQPIVVYNVVDRASVLHMPEYDARLLSWRTSSTTVTNASKNPDLYPAGRGQLVSFRVMITDTGSEPLQFGPLIARSSRPSYHPTATAELLLARAPGADEEIEYPALLNGRGAPHPSIFGQPPIQPHSDIVGWVSVVAPPWASSELTERATDLEFYPTDGNRDYVGQIRMWK